MVLMIVMLILALVAAAGVTVLMNPSFRQMMTPTPKIIERVLNSSGLNKDDWTLIRQRELTADERKQLQEGLLEKRIRVGYLPAEDERWFVAEMGAGQVPETLVERYYDQMLEASVRQPRQVVAGRPTRLVVEMRDYQRQLPDRKLILFVEGLYVGDAPEPLGRREMPTDIKQLPRQLYRTEVFVPESTGELRVRFAYWHIFGPPELLEQPIRWNDDGSATVPEDVIWSKHVVVEHAIEVTDVPQSLRRSD